MRGGTGVRRVLGGCDLQGAQKTTFSSDQRGRQKAANHCGTITIPPSLPPPPHPTPSHLCPHSRPQFLQFADILRIALQADAAFFNGGTIRSDQVRCRVPKGAGGRVP